MARAEFEQVTKRFDDVVALAEFTLAVADGELVTVLGPSGCGKSTLLRLTAGLEPLSSGSIRVDGRPIERLAPHRSGGAEHRHPSPRPVPVAHVVLIARR